MSKTKVPKSTCPSCGAKFDAAIPVGKLLTAKAAAAELGLPYTTFRTIVFNGEIPLIKIGASWYHRRVDIEQWLASRAERVD
jgi:excisionase family DNA binding protein